MSLHVDTRASERGFGLFREAHWQRIESKGKIVNLLWVTTLDDFISLSTSENPPFVFA